MYTTILHNKGYKRAEEITFFSVNIFACTLLRNIS